MSKPFQFKMFTIHQTVNSQKVGTDSMLLGAWVSNGDYPRILDIGTGTGILALMMAQRFEKATITAIEPHFPSYQEATQNFTASIYASNILSVNTSLQHFGAMEKFDLIISNPPYFESAFLSEDIDRNRTRHTSDLPIHEFYENISDLLSESGRLAIVIPYDLEETHLERAASEDLFPVHILRTKRSDGKFKRSLIQFQFEQSTVFEETLLVKDDQNKYSLEYINMTRDFYQKDLSEH